MKDGRFLSAQVIDRNRKGALGVLVDEHIIEEAVLTPPEQLVRRWLREAKTNAEIALILGMKPATVKNTSPTSSRNSASKTAPPPR